MSDKLINFPQLVGQLSTYVSSINHLLKDKNDNPTIGISSYGLNKLLPKELKNSLPSIEEIEKCFKNK